MGTRLALGLLAAAVGIVVLAGSAGAAVAGGGCHRPAAMRLTDERTDTVLASDCAFLPTVVRVEAGAAVMFTNNDVVPHSFTGVSSSFGDLNEYALGQSVTYTFEEPGVYPYFCALHPSMAGVVVVGDGTRAQGAGGGGDAGGGAGSGRRGR